MLDNLIQIFEQSLTVLLVFIFNEGDLALFLYKFVPFVLFMELPVYAFIWIGVIRSLQRRDAETPLTQPFLPRVSGVILSYSEGYEITPTVLSFLEQNYAGHIEVIIAVDGSIENSETYQAAVSMIALADRYQNRSIIVLPKIIRGGRVSSFNAAIKAASGTFLMPIDADTTMDNNVVQACVRHFIDPNTVAVSGPLRATANNHSVISRLQSIEYMISIYAGKLGLAEFGVINNIPGAFGIFRKSFVNSIGGWNTGTAEDLDMTVRIKQYLGRYPYLRIVFEPKAVAHTIVPNTLFQFLSQRLRWDGDLSYIYLRKHRLAFSPKIIGVKNFIATLWYGISFQIVMPCLIFIYLVYMAFVQTASVFIATMVLIYIFYLLLTACQFIMFLMLLSERPREDIKLLWMLPVFPPFAFLIRIWSFVANLNEWFNKGHLDSTMAPWWVLKKDKY